MQKKEEFQYARLFDPDTGRMAVDFERDDLVIGPKTAKKIEENVDDCAVTVCCITYKHEDLIRQALDSFLMQKTNFNYKIFVGEDHGPDGTADIVREYAAKYPDKIVAFCREENMGAQSNLIDLCMRANSPYVAICEGDDYWIDEYKLQKQYDYMQEDIKTRVCYTHTEILAPEDWHLNNYYLHNEEGKMIWPDCIPGFAVYDYYTCKEFCKNFPGHTSSVFFRWNYDLEFPDWYFTGLLGDVPLVFLQMGTGRTKYLDDVTSVYRRSDVGVFMNHSTEEHFLKTRLDYVRLLKGSREYFEDYYGGKYVDDFSRRTSVEIANFLNGALKLNAHYRIDEAIQKYPSEFRNTLCWYKQQSDKYPPLRNAVGGEANAFKLRTNPRFRFFVKAHIKAYNGGAKVKKVIFAPFKLMVNKIKEKPDIHRYWKNAKVKKQKNLWVITSFRHQGYMDNTMYFYEYVVANHPEINIVWLTTDDEVIERLQLENKPVARMDEKEGIELMKKAEIAITDHFVMSDYSPKWGFNANTKVVQLWHGVGFKSMGDGEKVENTKEPGVQYSYDILPQPGDSAIKKFIKKRRYHKRAPFRELFEEYYMMVCPGMERVEKIGKIWNMPDSTFFMAGHPRDINVYEQKPDNDIIKIVYAPTYRFNVKHERDLIEGVRINAPLIQQSMEEIGGEFYLRLHPHTWRNYDSLLTSLTEMYDRIKIDGEPDIYTHIGTYNLLITDYSSIGLDFANLDKPVVFFCPDYEWFIDAEAGFGVDFPKVIPGVMVYTWKDTMKEIKLHLDDPARFETIRRERIKYFFDPSVNRSDNSERIVCEIKRRLELE